MSHIRCPLCGKNAPISTFDPSSLDLDLCVVSFRGLGRARGFAIDEEYSVLGDEVYSPQVAERVLDLCKMFLDRSVIDSEQIIGKLGLDLAVKTPTEPPVFTRPPDTYAKSALSDIRLVQAQEIIEQQKEELALERLVDRELVRFVKYYPFLRVIEDEIPWSIEITDVDEERLPFLIVLFERFTYHERKTLLKRVSTNHHVVKKLLERLTRRKKQYPKYC